MAGFDDKHDRNERREQMTTDNPQTLTAPGRSESVATDPYIAAFETFAPAAAAVSPAWMNQIRKAAVSQFSELGLPTVRHEEWRYTNVSAVARLPFRPAPPAVTNLQPSDLAPFTCGDAHLLVFFNGRFSSSLSSFEQEVRILSLAAAAGTAGIPELEAHLARHAPYNENPFTALNTAFFQDGAVVLLPPNTKLSRPVHLLFLTADLDPGDTVHPRNLIVAAKGSEAVVIETYASLSDTSCATNAVTEIVVEPGASVEHLKFQNQSLQSFHFATIQAVQARESRFTSHSISIGAKLARNDIRILLNGPGSEAILNGLYLGKDDQLVDHHTVVDHAMPHCDSHEFYHGILDDRSQGVFNGKIFVRKDAQKTNAKQTSRSLLLSEGAAINAKPQLEIFADDVKCTHGATVGQLDDTALFYLRSRGIPHDLARRMLIYAFASDVVNRVQLEALRGKLERLLHDRFD